MGCAGGLALWQRGWCTVENTAVQLVGGMSRDIVSWSASRFRAASGASRSAFCMRVDQKHADLLYEPGCRASTHGSALRAGAVATRHQVPQCDRCRSIMGETQRWSEWQTAELR